MNFPKPAHRLAAVLLAAGKSERFGSPKQLENIAGEPMIRRSLNRLSNTDVEKVFIALGANSEAIKAHMATHLSEDVTVIDVCHWENGIGHSIAESTDVVASLGFSHLLIALSDQVDITTQAFLQLVNVSRVNPEKIVAAKYDDTYGVPSIFPRWTFEDLAQLRNDTGAKSILKEHSEQLVLVPMQEAKIDIDTPIELANWYTNNGELQD